jgi:hypothetical protein
VNSNLERVMACFKVLIQLQNCLRQTEENLSYDSLCLGKNGTFRIQRRHGNFYIVSDTPY